MLFILCCTHSIYRFIHNIKIVAWLQNICAVFQPFSNSKINQITYYTSKSRFFSIDAIASYKKTGLVDLFHSFTCSVFSNIRSNMLFCSSCSFLIASVSLCSFSIATLNSCSSYECHSCTASIFSTLFFVWRSSL